MSSVAAKAAVTSSDYLSTNFVVWGGNPTGLKVGDRVNFWGHSWKNQVQGGDYAAQADFKGFADSLAAFSCCQPTATSATLTQSCWTTKPGQSFPPTTLPGRIGVLVATSIAKSKSALYGNVAGIAVVDVEPGYGSTPGKPGWGTVVAFADGCGVFGGLSPQLTASQSQPAVVLPGQDYDVSVVLTNTGSGAAQQVAVTEQFVDTTPASAQQVVGTLAANASQSVSFVRAYTPLATRQATETSADYLARLAAANGASLTSSGLVTYADSAGAAMTPISLASASVLDLPILGLGISGPTSVQVGGELVYSLTITNSGRAVAKSPVLRLELGGSTATLAVPASLAPGASFQASHTLASPMVAGSVAAQASLQWQDEVGNDYGTVTSAWSTEVVRPPAPVLAALPHRLPLLLPSQTATATLDVHSFVDTDATAVVLSVANPDGSPAGTATFDVPGLATATHTFTVQAPAFAPRADGESELAYRARLATLAALPLTVTNALTWADAWGGSYGPFTGSQQTAEIAPVLDAQLSAKAPKVEAGESAALVARIGNSGLAEATTLALTLTLPDGSRQAVSLAGAGLAAGTAVELPLTYAVGFQQPAGSLSFAVSLTWTDAIQNLYGPLTSTVAVEVVRSNEPPAVTAGPDQTITLPALASLEGYATDDGKPAPLSFAWVQVSGPGTATILDPTALTTQATFSAPGTYIFRLTASDSQLTASAEMKVTVLRQGASGTIDAGEQVPGETLINVVRDGNQLRLGDQTTAFHFIWVAVSTKGTVVKIDTDTGRVLGEYWTSPDGQPKDPSRTTVDKNGSVWATNRAGNSVLRIGLVENAGCVDRNGNGKIDTSGGLNDVRRWSNLNGADTNGGVSTAEDECIINYTRVSSWGTRHVSVDANNDVWVSGTGNREFDLLDGRTGQIKRHEPSVVHGGYGGLIDSKGVIWSANPLLRWDTALPLTGQKGGNWRGWGHDSYGLCIDLQGNVWNTSLYEGVIRRFAPDGTLLGSFSHGYALAQGCAIDRSGDVWVAHSWWGQNTIGRLKNDGTFVGNVTIPSGATGVAVDAQGKIWSTNYNTRNVSRIDPNLGPLGPDGVTHVGAVELTTVDLGGNLYNYSDMTGSTLIGSPPSGTWSFVHDSGTPGALWGRASWSAQVCGDGLLTLRAASSEDGSTFSSEAILANGQAFNVPNGRYLKISVSFKRSTKGESPRLYGLTLGTLDYPLPFAENKAPTIHLDSPRATTLPDPFRLTASACDDGLPGTAPLALTWAQVSGPGTATFGTPAAEATDVAFSGPGTYVLRLTANDGERLSSAEVTVEAYPRNSAPVVDAGPAQAVTLPVSALLAGTATDDGKPIGALTVAWSKVSGPGTVTFQNPAQAATEASFSAAGTYVLRLAADDSQLTASADVTVTVNPAPASNLPPVVSAGPAQAISFGSAAQLSGSVTDDGLPGGALSVSWSQVSGPGTATFAAPTSAATTATFSAAGVYVLRVSASDGALNASADTTVAVDVPLVPNQPPSISAGPVHSVTLPGLANLAGSATDDGLPAGSALAVAWSKTSGPGTVTFGSSSSPVTTASFSVAGSYVLRLTASDGQFTAWTETLVVVYPPASANRPPVVTVAPVAAITLPQNRVMLSGNVRDDGLPTGSSVSLLWSQVSGPTAATVASPSSASTFATVPAAGTYVFRLTASDSVLSARGEVSVTVLAVPGVNKAPVVAVSPDQTIQLPQREVTLTGTATDDGLPSGGLTGWWEQVDGPAAVSFAALADPTQVGVTLPYPGVYSLRYSVSDSILVSSALVKVTVLPDGANHAPVVSAGPSQTVALGDPATLSGSVRDDGLPAYQSLTAQWSQVSGPGTATFTQPTQVRTHATFTALGTYALRLTASDGEKEESSEVTVEVVPGNAVPVVAVGPDQALAYPNVTGTLTGSATDDGQPAGSILTYTWSLKQGPGGVTFGTSDQPTTTATFGFPGSYLVELTASDGEKSGSAQLVVTVGAPSGSLPTVAIESPLDGARMVSPTAIVGSVSEGAWQIEYALGGDDSEPQAWVAFGSGAGPVVSGTLGTLDTTMLLNGAYAVRLTAMTAAGNATDSIGVVVDKNLKVGNFTVAFTDLAVPVSGLPIELTRTYDSRDKSVGDFGVGWQLGIRNARVEKTAPIGRHWDETKEGYFALPTYCVRTTKATNVTVTFPDNRVYRFAARAKTECQWLVPIEETDVVYEPLPGTHGTLVVEGNPTVMLDTHVGLPGPVHLMNWDLSVYNPKGFVLTTEDGTVFHLEQGFGVKSVTDLNGNSLTITRDGIVHSSGKGVSFERDRLGRITTITDPAGNLLTYGYDERGDLRTFTDRESSTSKFTYDTTHRLLTIEDPKGIQPIRNEYDDAGRLIAHTDAYGKRIEYTHELAANTEVVTDRLGRQRTLEYDNEGNVLRETDALGRTTVRTYDAESNLLTETNPAGETTTHTYDALGNLTSTTDALGNVTRQEWGDCRKLIKTTDARGHSTVNEYERPLGSLCPTTLKSTTDAAGHVTSFVYDGGNLTSRTDALGHATGYVYDGYGNQTKGTNALGVATTFTYDSNGNRLTETATKTTPQGVETLVTRYSYDKNGRLLTRTDPDGTVSGTTYDVNGKRLTSTDKLGRVTSYEYDLMGRLTKTTFSDGTSESSTYDAEGRALTSIDRGGRVTGYEYDEVGRLTKTTYADGSTSQTGYDSAGRVSTSTDARGNVTSYGYDGAGRRTSVTDARGHLMQYAYDAAGTLASTIDAKNQVTTYEYDSVGNRVKTIFADATSRQTGYDALGRRTSETDQAGKVTQFGYDALGRLTTVTDALSHVTSYGYDERGNRISQTDANGHTTAFEHDALGRETKRTLPDGKYESKTYDVAGNLATRTNFLGQSASYVYDSGNRLTERRYPDGSVVTFGYTATGRRLWAQDGRGVTGYGYDERGRLISITYPDGRGLGFGYDAQGNHARLAATIGGLEYATTYSFDALNRLDTVTDAAGRSYVHGYDANGNRESLSHPNGVATGYGYDALNRLKSLDTKLGAYTIQGYAFTLGPTGNRTRIDEADGTFREFTYDDLYRLTGETATKAGAVQYAGGFAYDAVGNRLSQTKNGVLTSSSYDERDRLLSEGSATYGWDDEGNLGTKTGADGATYEWDFDHRLKKVTKADRTVVEHTYDADGVRVQTKTTKAGVTTVQNYLVDTSGALSHAVAETDEAGALKALYVRGDDLLAVIRASGTKYVHADGLGSIRKLTDESGAVTDSYTYNAFGELLEHNGSDPQPYMFAGEAWEGGTGLYYNRARWLDVGTGRFVSSDSYSGSNALPLSLHKYLYGNANPAMNRDPTGNMSLGETMAAVVVGSILASLAIPADSPFTHIHRACAVDEARCSRFESEGQAQLRALAVPPGADVDANIELAKKHFQDEFWFASMVEDRGAWDYWGGRDGYEQYAPYGNFNYGATGAAAGFGESVLLRAAGGYQIYTDTLSRLPRDSDGRPYIERGINYSQGWPWGDSPYGDDPIDQPWIKLGIEYFYCRHETSRCAPCP
ncbi:MAG: PKD domain-containing protein [Myxococcales bacterium]